MHAEDNAFFEEYKRLDRLCGDMYACQNGVSAYLAAMESKAVRGSARVACWDSDYRQLKHVRWVRNRIAHDSGSLRISEPDDLAFVQDFYNRIFEGRDALTLLRKAEEQPRQKQQKYAQQTIYEMGRRPEYRRPFQGPQNSAGNASSWQTFVFAILLFGAAVLLFWR